MLRNILLSGTIVACSSSEERTSISSTVPAPTPVWTATSVRLELSSFGYWNGSSGYAKDRADLTAEQLLVLSGLRTVPTPTDTMVDRVSHRLRIVDEDGSSVTYRAAERNRLDHPR